MGYLGKYTKEIFASSIIFIFYLITRLIVLTNVPIFTDEAIYLRWAQIANNDASWRFISLTDGKQPLFIWLVMGVMRVVSDPLVAGRLVSVGAGVFTMIGLFLVSRELFKNKWVGIISAGLYAIFPFALVYDRLAVYDSLVGTFAVWGLYFTILLVRYIRLDLAFILGFVTGAAVLNKSNGFFTIYLFPVALLLFDLRKKDVFRKLQMLAGLFLLVVVMTYGFYSILRLSPYFYLIAQKNSIFVYPLKEWIHHPFTFVWQNFKALEDWFIVYMKWPFILSVFASLFINKKYLREKLVLIAWFVLPFIALVLFGKTIYPRYLFFMTLSLLPLIAYTIFHLISYPKKQMVGIVLSILIISIPLYTNGLLLTNFPKAPIPTSDKVQLFTDWPSGAGVKESITFFREQQKKHGKIVVATAGTFGLMPYAYELYFWNNPNIQVKGFWPVEQIPPQAIMTESKKTPTYFVFYQECVPCQGKGLAPLRWSMIHQVFQYKKIAPGAFLTVYEVNP